LTDTPEQPEGEASRQDMDLEAQLDELLHRLEEVDPDTVPADLRKKKPDKPQAADAVSDQAAAGEPAQAQPAVEAPEPIEAVPAETGASADAAAPTDTASRGQDLEAIASMASDLLDQQIDATIESASGQAKPKENLSPEDATGSASLQAPQPAASVGEDDLASQIQGLLNEVQAKGVDAIADKEPTAPRVKDEPRAQESQAVTEAGSESDEPAEVKEPTEAPAEADGETTALADQAGAVSIHQIDEMLAESAQQAIEHGPAPATDIPPGTDEVLAAQDRAEQEAQARAEAERDAAELPGAQEAEAQPQPATEPVAEPVAVQAQPVAVSGASAEDVAEELDEDANAEPVPADESARAVSAEPVTGDAPSPGGVGIDQSRLKKAEYALLQICGKINRPLNRLSPQMRDTVGYVGVVTTALALFMVLYGLLF